MKLRSYAKVNLTLDILGKRDDDYHELETIFQHINLYDEIELEEIEGGIEVECEGIKEKENFAYKAASLLKNRFNVEKGIRIKIVKNIPIGAGLSGGSSNAAAVLKGLNVIWGLGLNKEQLMDISREIGMDVGFHILGGTCRGKERGDILEKIHDLEKHYVVLCYPGFGISTREAYNELDYSKTGKKRSSEKFLKDFKMHNDFEYSVFKRYPELEKIKSALGEKALLSGSGSCVFGMYKSEDEAKDAMERLNKKYRVFLTTTLNKRIELAKEMGFCFGVKRAVEEINKMGNVSVLGKLIHNPQVIEQLEQNGVRIVEDVENVTEGTVVISAHGVPDKTIDLLKQKGLKIKNLTCPLVNKVHEITKDAERRGRKVIVFGEKNHTEVKGIVGNLKDYKVIKDVSELTEEDLQSSITLVSQTTRELERFNELAEKMRSVIKDIEVKDTICAATRNRQKSAIELARKCDFMIVVGGRISSNTKRLKEVCSKYRETEHIETEKEINYDWFFGKERIGITAGASTPEEVIEGVKNAIEAII